MLFEGVTAELSAIESILLRRTGHASFGFLFLHPDEDDLCFFFGKTKILIVRRSNLQIHNVECSISSFAEDFNYNRQYSTIISKTVLACIYVWVKLGDWSLSEWFVDISRDRVRRNLKTYILIH